LSNVCDCQKEILNFGKENHRLDLGVKNIWKIYMLAYKSCFFVTSTSG
jgi:hypothetical protein